MEEMVPRGNKDLWELPVKGDLGALRGPNEVKGQWDHRERWVLKEPRATKANRARQLLGSLRGTGNSAPGVN